MAAETPDPEAETDRPPCVICDGPSVTQAFPSRPWLDRGEVNDEGNRVLVRLPPYYLCDQDMTDLTRGLVDFGWCDDPKCRRWGRLGSPSPCGALYMRIPEA